MDETVRIPPNDCLATWRMELERSAFSLTPWHASGQCAWMDAAVDLLASVPDMGQRCAWTLSLAGAFAARFGLPVELIAGYLLHRAKGGAVVRGL
jgi:hypothetical protein